MRRARPFSKPKQPEDALHRDVARYLARVLTDETVWFHPPNGGGRSKREGAKFKAQGVKAGVADIVLVYQGRHFEIELKSATGKQSESQEAWQAALERAGGKYVVSKSVEDVKMALRDFGIPTRETIYERQSPRDN
jgi:hypothetical protein